MGGVLGQEHVGFAPLFGHQYSHVWIDFHDIQDAYMRERGIDCFWNSRRATLVQRAYAKDNPAGWRGYGGDIWGLTPAVVPGIGWFDTDYRGIDQGPILLMIENFRTGLIWDLMKKSPHIVRGLRRAGFEGGWLDGSEIR